MKIKMTMRLYAKIKREGKYFVSCCPQLDVWSQGDTEEDAKNMLAEAVSLFLVSCFERGTLDEVLSDCGFKAVAQPSNAKDIEEKTPRGMTPFDAQVPFMFTPQRHRDAQKCPA